MYLVGSTASISFFMRVRPECTVASIFINDTGTYLEVVLACLDDMNTTAVILVQASTYTISRFEQKELHFIALVELCHNKTSAHMSKKQPSA